MKRYDSSVTQAGTRSTGIVTETVFVPCLRCGITAIALGLLVRLAAYAVAMPSGDAWAMAGAIGLVAFLWAWLRPRPRENTTWEREIEPQSERVILVNARPTDAPPDRHGRFARFVQAAEQDTSARRMESLGFTREEVDEFRTALIRTNWAEWRSEADRRAGWTLTAPADDILEALA